MKKKRKPFFQNAKIRTPGLSLGIQNMNRPPRRKSGLRFTPATQPGLRQRARAGTKKIIASGISVAKHLVQSSIAVLVILILTVTGYGLLLRAFSPKPLIVVDPFEVPNEIAKDIGLDGKN